MINDSVSSINNEVILKKKIYYNNLNNNSNNYQDFKINNRDSYNDKISNSDSINDQKTTCSTKNIKNTKGNIKDSQIINYLPIFSARKSIENSKMKIQSLKYPSWARSELLIPICTDSDLDKSPDIEDTSKKLIDSPVPVLKTAAKITKEEPGKKETKFFNAHNTDKCISDSLIPQNIMFAKKIKEEVVDKDEVKNCIVQITKNSVNDTVYSNWNKGITQVSNIKKENNNYNISTVPPIVRLTSKSIETGDNIYALSRFRDHRIYYNVRIFLSYFYDQDDICYEGMTKTNLKVLIHQEGLPNDYKELSKLYFLYHETTGLTKKEVLQDLAIYRRHIDNKYREYLQRIRESWQNYMLSKP